MKNKKRMNLIILYLIKTILIINEINTQYIPSNRHDYRLNEKYLLTYKYSSTPRHTTSKQDPDSFFFGFFPIWSAILIGLTGTCLLVSIIGIFCWLAGCNNPRNVLKRESKIYKKQLEKQQQDVYLEEQLYDDISMRMIDTFDKHNSSLFADTKLVSEYDLESKIYLDAKKKRFMRDHL